MRSLIQFRNCLLLGAITYSMATTSNQYNLVTSLSYPSGSLIKNGSFENNYTGIEYEGWSESPGNPPDRVAYRSLPLEDVVKPYNGRGMAAIQFSAPSNLARFLVSDPFPVKPNTWYTFFVRYRTSNYSPATEDYKIRPIFQTFRSKNTLDATEEEYLVSTERNGAGYVSASDWTQYVHRFHTGSDANFCTVSLLWGATSEIAATSTTSAVPPASGTFYFDDVYLNEGCIKSTAGETLPTGCPVADAGMVYGQDPRHPDYNAISRKFLDGKNKVVQNVTQDGLRDIVTQNFYDELGRLNKATLPIGNNMGVNQHNFVAGILADFSSSDYLANYYHPGSGRPPLDDALMDPSASPPQYPEANGFPYSETKYDDSPLGRPIESAGPGQDWRMGGGHTSKVTYTSVPEVLDYDVLPATSSSNNGQFYVKEVTSIDGKVMREFTDKSGRIVRKSAKLVSGGVTKWINTDYQYDANGNIVQMQAPGASSRLTSTMTYNLLNQMISETTPATGTTHFLYDNLGRIRLTQTENQAHATPASCSFVRYDTKGRIIITGEVIGSLLFSSENAKLDEFPCAQNCVDPRAFLSMLNTKYRMVNQYDNGDDQISCQGGSSGTPQGSTKSIFFLAEKSNGEVVASGYDLVETYHQVLDLLQGQTIDMRILALYEPQGDHIVAPLQGSEMAFQVGGITISLEGLSTETPDGITVKNLFLSLQAQKVSSTLGSGDYLEGRLVKTLSCNYELAEVLGESAPREVSKVFRYDKFGNVIRVLETNRYVDNLARQVQLVKNEFDVQNRLIQKTVCADVDCKSELSHIEKYQYDQLGRISKILDKQDGVIAQNHYNYIGQLSNVGMGSLLAPSSTSHGLFQHNEYDVHGWLKNIQDEKIKDNTSLFQENLSYQDGPTAKFDGTITKTKYTYDRSLASRKDLEYAYKYDDMNRLTNADDITQALNADGSAATLNDNSTAYTYLDDGRIAAMHRAGRVGTYDYNSENGRLKEVAGDLVQDRDMNLTPEKGYVFQYDFNGNLTEDKSKIQNNKPLEIFYRSDNRPYLFVYTLPGSTDEYQVYMAYDEAGNRVSKRTFVNDTWRSNKSYFTSGKEIREGLGHASVEFYPLAGIGRVKYTGDHSAGEKEFYLKNHLGTTQETYDFDAGAMVYASHYFPYGKQFDEFRTASEDVTEKFTGKELDDGINLSYFGARYYDADIGIWISPDPARQYYSPFTYCGNNPIGCVDNDGKLGAGQLNGWAYYSTSHELSSNGQHLAGGVASIAGGTVTIALAPIEVTGSAGVASPAAYFQVLYGFGMWVTGTRDIIQGVVGYMADADGYTDKAKVDDRGPIGTLGGALGGDIGGRIGTALDFGYGIYGLYHDISELRLVGQITREQAGTAASIAFGAQGSIEDGSKAFEDAEKTMNQLRGKEVKLGEGH